MPTAPVPVGGGLLNVNRELGFDNAGRVVLTYHKYDAAGDLQAALAATPFKPEVFEPFLQDVERARHLPLLQPDAAEWLPEPGGILYAPDVVLFHQLFYQRPHGGWRYMVGFEPGLLPPQDLDVYRDFLRRGTVEALRPWVARMQPRDRLVLELTGGASPGLPELEWKHLGGHLWSGRLPRGGAR